MKRNTKEHKDKYNKNINILKNKKHEHITKITTYKNKKKNRKQNKSKTKERKNERKNEMKAKRIRKQKEQSTNITKITH